MDGVSGGFSGGGESGGGGRRVGHRKFVSGVQDTAQLIISVLRKSMQ